MYQYISTINQVHYLLKLIAKFLLGSVGPAYIISVYFHGMTGLSRRSTDDSVLDKDWKMEH